METIIWNSNLPEGDDLHFTAAIIYGDCLWKIARLVAEAIQRGAEVIAVTDDTDIGKQDTVPFVRENDAIVVYSKRPDFVVGQRYGEFQKPLGKIYKSNKDGSVTEYNPPHDSLRRNAGNPENSPI